MKAEKKKSPSTADFWKDFPREAITVSPSSPAVEQDAERLMQHLGFLKVKYACVYEGPVKNLICGLLKLGWKSVRIGDNPHLLAHPDSTMLFNHARSEGRFVAYFHGGNMAKLREAIR